MVEENELGHIPVHGLMSVVHTAAAGVRIGISEGDSNRATVATNPTTTCEEQHCSEDPALSCIYKHEHINMYI